MPDQNNGPVETQLAQLKQDLKDLVALWRKFSLQDRGDAQQVFLYGGMTPQTAADQIERILEGHPVIDHLRDQLRVRK